ncbi:hypothetical protein BH20ACT9_BH20ACT9_03230 [soil metagenome]
MTRSERCHALIGLVMAGALVAHLLMLAQPSVTMAAHETDGPMTRSTHATAMTGSSTSTDAHQTPDADGAAHLMLSGCLALMATLGLTLALVSDRSDRAWCSPAPALGGLRGSFSRQPMPKARAPSRVDAGVLLRV